MNFHEESSIPIIDFKDFIKPGNSFSSLPDHSYDSFLELAERLVEALSTVGFVYVKSHGILQDVIENAFQTSRRFFALPLAEKSKTKVERASRHGYVRLEAEGVNPQRKSGDFRESFDITKQGTLWPSDGDFRQHLCRLVSESQRLCRLLLRLLGVGLRLEDPDFFADNHDLDSTDNTSQLRTLFYPLVESGDLKEDQVQLGEHTDYGTLTLLFQRGVGGLEVQTRRGGDYVPAPPLDGAILVNIGDMMERWTAGSLRATFHRVVNPLPQERQSIAFFLHPREDLVIEALQFKNTPVECGNRQPMNDGKTEFQPITAKDYFDKRFTETFEDNRM